MKEVTCAACNRRQLLRGPGFPQGLSYEECKIIGWSQDGKAWLCPFHTPGGVAKLAEVAKKGLSGS